MTIAPEITHPTELLPLSETAHYFNREQSWLEFNRRVLEEALDERNPLLERGIRNRFPYMDPLNHVQVELLKEHRAQNPDEQVLRGIQITINGISAGLRNSG